MNVEGLTRENVASHLQVSYCWLPAPSAHTRNCIPYVWKLQEHVGRLLPAHAATCHALTRQQLGQQASVSLEYHDVQSIRLSS